MEIDKIVKHLQRSLDCWKPIPFWSWNGELKEQELIRQIDAMKRYGMGGYFMHARSGLKTEYLSEDWMRCVKTCVDHGAVVGMDSWIYDENGWPSGFVGGKLLEKEEYRDQYLLYTIGSFEPGASVSYRLDKERLIRVTS